MELKKQGISIPIVKEFLFKKICQVEGPQEGAHMVLKYQFNNPDIFDDAVRDALNQLVYAFFMGAGKVEGAALLELSLTNPNESLPSILHFDSSIVITPVKVSENILSLDIHWWGNEKASTWMLYYQEKEDILKLVENLVKKLDLFAKKRIMFDQFERMILKAS